MSAPFALEEGIVEASELGAAVLGAELAAKVEVGGG
jgi:hypothetical protein